MRNKLFTPEEIASVTKSVSRGYMAGKLYELLSSREIYEGQFGLNKPWGIELKIRENLAGVFLDSFFDREALSPEVVESPFGPKILAIEGAKRLSWHVHERKDAFLKVLAGRLHVYKNSTDEEVEPMYAETGELIHIPEQIRHRLGSVTGWAVVAEISRNVFPGNPSNDRDERRISDDYGRA